MTLSQILAKYPWLRPALLALGIAATPVAMVSKFALSPSPPTLNPYWSVTTWYRNFASGSDSNTCQSSGSPCKTRQHIWSLLNCGTCLEDCRFQQNVAFIDQAPDTDNTDPGCIRGAGLERGATIAVSAVLPTPTVSSTFTGSVTTNRANGTSTPQVVADSVNGTSLAAGQLVVTTVHAAKGWIASKPLAHSAYLTQPLAPVTPPTSTIAPAEVNNISTEAYNAYVAMNENWTSLDVRVVDYSAASTPNLPMTVQNLDIYDPLGAGADPVYIGPNVSMFDVKTDRQVVLTSTSQDVADATFSDVFVNGGISGGRLTTGHLLHFNGGIVGGTSTVCNVTGAGVVFDGDAWIAQACNFPSNVQVALADMQTATLGSEIVTFGLGTSVFAEASGGYGVLAIWGGSTNATMNVTGTLKYDSSQGGWTGIVLGNNVTVNGATTGCSETNAQPAVWNCGVTVNAAAIDNASIGTTGFAGNVYGLGGGRIVGNLQ